MIRQALIPFIILILLTSCGAQKKLLPSKENNPTENVLIIGAGSVASRIFMDNLWKNLDGRLNKRKIKTNLVFVENSKPGAQFDRPVLDSLNYDAYIIFYPVNSADLTMNGTTKIPLVYGASVNAISPNYYKQEFSVQIYMKADKAKPVWEKNLPVDIDLLDEKNYDQISAYILNYLPLY